MDNSSGSQSSETYGYETLPQSYDVSGDVPVEPTEAPLVTPYDEDMPGTEPAFSYDIIPEQEVEETPTVSRRLVLRGLTGIAGTVLVGAQAEYTDAVLSRTFLAPDARDTAAGAPPELRHLAIDYTNEHYQSDCGRVVATGIEQYKQTGGRPYYRRPACYISKTQMLGALMPWSTGAYAANPEPYQQLLNFTTTNPTSAESLLIGDPGSSTKPAALQRRAALGSVAEKLFRPDDPGSPTIGDAAIVKAYRQAFTDTLSYLDRQRGHHKVSTAALYTHYLQQNGGDIVTSLIDTTLFLKMAARMDIEVLTGDPKKLPWIISRPSYANARLINERFYDDFSPALPLSTLLQAVDEYSSLNDFDIATRNPADKDYDPVNRAGTAYHVWNIMTLAACAAPATVEQLVIGYYNTYENNYDTTKTQGGIKVAADMHALSQVRPMRKLFDRYAVG